MCEARAGGGCNNRASGASLSCLSLILSNSVQQIIQEVESHHSPILPAALARARGVDSLGVARPVRTPTLQQAWQAFHNPREHRIAKQLHARHTAVTPAVPTKHSRGIA